MEIKHSISFFLPKVYSRTGNGEGQIRLRIRWNGLSTENRLRLDFLATEGAFKVCAADYGSDFSASTR